MKKDDKALRELFNKELPAARENPWFVNKVLNRLPPRRNPGALLEKWIFLLCFIAAIVCMIVEIVNVVHLPVIYVKNVLMLSLYFFIFLGMALWLFIPLAKEN